MTVKSMDAKNSEQIDHLIARFLAGNASAIEVSELESWIHESGENLQYYRHLRNIWDATADLPIATDKALKQVQNRMNKGNRGISLLQFFQRAAAILVIPLMLAVIWLTVGKISKNPGNTVYHESVAAFGTFSVLQLPDGSKVWLNSGSSLRYPEQFDENHRTVSLVGEGYFEVNANEKVPFLVTTPYFTVKATGTRFNVRAEKDYRIASVTLVEGKVAIQKLSTSDHPETLAHLQPNQHMSYDTLSGKFHILTEDIYKHFAWKDGKLVFRNDPITEVARRISLQYNVDIEIKGTEIKKYRYRATFENEPLGELLRLLKISSPIDYTEIKPRALPDGSFSRRKIIIYAARN